MIRGFTRRLENLEVISRADSFSFSHLLRFITPEHEVVSTLLIETGKPSVWTHCKQEERASGSERGVR